MEIHKKLHTVSGGTLTDLNRIFNITVAAAIAVSVRVKGIIPYTHADVVDSVFGEDLINILFHTVMVIIANPARLKRRHCGCIHTKNKILRDILHLFHIERFGNHVRVNLIWPPIASFFRPTGCESRSYKEHCQKSADTFLSFSHIALHLIVCCFTLFMESKHRLRKF